MSECYPGCDCKPIAHDDNVTEYCRCGKKRQMPKIGSHGDEYCATCERPIREGPTPPPVGLIERMRAKKL
jgi:hypothetical protein